MQPRLIIWLIGRATGTMSCDVGVMYIHGPMHQQVLATNHYDLTNEMHEFLSNSFHRKYLWAPHRRPSGCHSYYSNSMGFVEIF